MTSYVTSADGSRIAFDRLGEGPPVVVVAGMFCDRQTLRELAEHLASRCDVINFDRRGRGDSGDTPPYAVAAPAQEGRGKVRWSPSSPTRSTVMVRSVKAQPSVVRAKRSR